MMMTLGAVLAAVSLYLWRVILTERSAIHHQCEHEYVLWPMAVFFECVFVALLLNYFFTESSFWASTSDSIFLVVLTGILGWYFMVFFRMSHICLTFYTIKYPVLLASPNICGPVAILVWMAIVARRLALGYFDEEDPTTFTQLFYTANKDFVHGYSKKRRLWLTKLV